MKNAIAVANEEVTATVGFSTNLLKIIIRKAKTKANSPPFAASVRGKQMKQRSGNHLEDAMNEANEEVTEAF